MIPVDIAIRMPYKRIAAQNRQLSIELTHIYQDIVLSLQYMKIIFV